MPSKVQRWIADIRGADKLRLFNNGQPCGPFRTACDNLDLCPGDPNVKVKVMAVNLGSCTGSNENVDSIVFKVMHKQVSIMFNGDFEDETEDQNENGVQKAMIDYYGEELKVTVYKISHHGAQTLANKINTCHAHAPKAIFANANSHYSVFRHPRCDVIDRFLNDVRSLCKPLVTDPASPFYCGAHPEIGATADQKLQKNYACYEKSIFKLISRKVTGNEFAIFTTVPDTSHLNLIRFTSDGTRWGFIKTSYSASSSRRKMNLTGGTSDSSTPRIFSKTNVAIFLTFLGSLVLFRTFRS